MGAFLTPFQRAHPSTPHSTFILTRSSTPMGPSTQILTTTRIIQPSRSPPRMLASFSPTIRSNITGRFTSPFPWVLALHLFRMLIIFTPHIASGNSSHQLKLYTDTKTSNRLRTRTQRSTYNVELLRTVRRHLNVRQRLARGSPTVTKPFRTDAHSTSDPPSLLAFPSIPRYRYHSLFTMLTLLPPFLLGCYNSTLFHFHFPILYIHLLSIFVWRLSWTPLHRRDT